jgi:hypothetical protein
MKPSNEGQLVKMMLERYKELTSLSRPVRNSTQTIRVDFGLGLQKILDIDEKNQVLATYMWLHQVCIISHRWQYPQLNTLYLKSPRSAICNHQTSLDGYSNTTQCNVKNNPVLCITILAYSIKGN